MVTQPKRRPVRLLPLEPANRLLLRDGECLGDLRPESGGRTVRMLGCDRDRPYELFDERVEEPGDGLAYAVALALVRVPRG